MFAYGFFYHLRAVYVTCGALAEHYKILAYRLQSELCIESRYTINFSRFDTCSFGYVVYSIYRKITINILSFLQDN